MSCSCGNGCASGCGCLCLPVPGIFDCNCIAPDLISTGAHLSVLDGSFCERRLANTGGLLQAFETGSGAFQISFTNKPSPNLATFSVTTGAEFGNLVAINADGKMRQLDFPNSPSLFLQTNASGQLIAAALPAQAVPDPLTITTLNATTVNTGALNATGAVAFTGLGLGTISQAVGLDGSGNLIRGGSSSGVQSAMFFESATGSSTATPNAGIVPGSFAVIGNLLFDTGGSIASVQDSQTVKVNVAGTYRINYCGQFDGGPNVNRVGPALLLSINGTVVNNGNTTPTPAGSPPQAGTNRNLEFTGMDLRTLAANDVIKLQLSSSAGSTVTNLYQVRLILDKIG